MHSFNTALIAGACALGVAATPVAVQAAPKSQPSGNSVGGVSMKDIQEVGRGFGGGGGRGFGGGGRGFSGGHGFSGRGFGGGRGWGGRGFASRGYGWRGRGYGYRGRYGYYRGRGWGWGPYYAGAAVAGVAIGAAAASPYYYDDDYYDEGYAPRRVYRGSECQVISRRHDVDGRPVKVIRYRPC